MARFRIAVVVLLALAPASAGAVPAVPSDFIAESRRDDVGCHGESVVHLQYGMREAESSAGGRSCDPSSVLFEEEGVVLALSDDSVSAVLVRVDPNTGVRRIVARDSVGLAFGLDTLLNFALFVELEADPTGTRGAGSESPVDVTVSPEGDISLSSRRDVQEGRGSIHSTGADAAATGAIADLLEEPLGLVIDANGDLLVMDEEAFAGRGGVVRVDVGTRARKGASSGESSDEESGGTGPRPNGVDTDRPGPASP